MSLWTDFLGAEIRYVEAGEFGRTRIAEAGRGKKDAIFFMHGTNGHLEAYAPNLVPLADEFHCIAFDFYGCGLSERNIKDFTPALLAEQLAALMDALGIEKAHLSGESLGGMVAGAFAGKYPQRTRRLMLNTTGGLPISTEKGRQDLRELIALMTKVADTLPTFETIQQRMKWLMHPSNWHLLDGELVESRLKIYLMPEARLSNPAIIKFISALETFDIDLDKIQAETLFLWTRDNPINTVEDARIACGKVKNARMYVMEADSAHWPQFEAPDEFNRVTRNFFRDGTVPVQ